MNPFSCQVGNGVGELGPVSTHSVSLPSVLTCHPAWKVDHEKRIGNKRNNSSMIQEIGTGIEIVFPIFLLERWKQEMVLETWKVLGACIYYFNSLFPCISIV